MILLRTVYTTRLKAQCTSFDKISCCREIVTIKIVIEFGELESNYHSYPNTNRLPYFID